ncbi:hypothetical protein Fmac_030580 [Flemingia macrophylla]|uniref:Uncharacterized protein n=1 Tax=Flemingia macrophylla TaxID=520843 RepID=A0ABD1KZM0_9FABA
MDCKVLRMYSLYLVCLICVELYCASLWNITLQSFLLPYCIGFKEVSISDA